MLYVHRTRLATEFTTEGHELRGFGVWDKLDKLVKLRFSRKPLLTLPFFLGPKKLKETSLLSWSS